MVLFTDFDIASSFSFGRKLKLSFRISQRIGAEGGHHTFNEIICVSKGFIFFFWLVGTMVLQVSFQHTVAGIFGEQETNTARY